MSREKPRQSLCARIFCPQSADEEETVIDATPLLTHGKGSRRDDYDVQGSLHRSAISPERGSGSRSMEVEGPPVSASPGRQEVRKESVEVSIDESEDSLSGEVKQIYGEGAEQVEVSVEKEEEAEAVPAPSDRDAAASITEGKEEVPPAEEEELAEEAATSQAEPFDAGRVSPIETREEESRKVVEEAEALEEKKEEKSEKGLTSKLLDVSSEESAVRELSSDEGALVSRDMFEGKDLLTYSLENNRPELLAAALLSAVSNLEPEKLKEFGGVFSKILGSEMALKPLSLDSLKKLKVEQNNVLRAGAFSLERSFDERPQDALVRILEAAEIDRTKTEFRVNVGGESALEYLARTNIHGMVIRAFRDGLITETPDRYVNALISTWKRGAPDIKARAEKAIEFLSKVFEGCNIIENFLLTFVNHGVISFFQIAIDNKADPSYKVGTPSNPDLRLFEYVFNLAAKKGAKQKPAIKMAQILVQSPKISEYFEEVKKFAPDILIRVTAGQTKDQISKELGLDSKKAEQVNIVLRIIKKFSAFYDSGNITFEDIKYPEMVAMSKEAEEILTKIVKGEISPEGFGDGGCGGGEGGSDDAPGVHAASEGDVVLGGEHG